MSSPINPSDVDTLAPFSFAAYLRRAAEREAIAVTLTADDLAEVAAMMREAQTLLDNGALDVSDLDVPVPPNPLERLGTALDELAEFMERYN